MKKLFVSIAAILALVACSKSEEAEVSVLVADDLTFKASFEGNDSRVSISEDGDGFKMAWSDDDEIAIYTRVNKTKYAYDPAAQVFTKVSDNAGARLEDYYYSVYPYTAASQKINAGTVSLDMPITQKYAVNSFGKGANTMVAICPKPTEASSEPVELQFKNVAGYLRLYLYGDNITIKSIELKGNNDEILAGQANVAIAEGVAPDFSWAAASGKTLLLSCDEGVKIGSSAAEATAFWFVVPPTVFEDGFKIRVTDSTGRVMQKSLDTKFEIKRNIVETMEPLAVEYSSVNENLIMDIQFNEDGSATDNGKYYMDVIAHPGQGMATVDDENYPYGKVVKFTNCDGENNAQITDSFYSIDYSNVIGFQNDLSDEDGFTLEMVVKHGILSRAGQHPWQNPASSNTFGVFLKGVDTSSNFGWMAARYASNDANSNPFTDAANLNYSPYLNKYYHYTYVYDKANSKVVFYCDGEFIREITDIAEIGAGNRFAIGGFPTSTSVVEHSFTGSVALVRMYDAAMTSAEAKARYEELDIPSTAKPVGQPLFDAQFNADGTAENVGTANVTIETKPNATVLTTKQKGGQYVANFHRDSKHNQACPDGFYLVDYSSNADFIGKLEDGYTMEVLCKVNPYEGDFWSKVMSTTTSGIHHQGAYSVETEAWCWGMYGNGKPDEWNSGFGWGSFRKNFLWGPKVTNTYEHVVMVWNAESNVFTLYVNGKYALSCACPAAANVGTLLAVGGIPYTNKNVYHPFVGEVAVARIYDEMMTHHQVLERLEELKPTLDALK